MLKSRFRFLFVSVRWKLVIIYLLLILFAMQLIGMYFVRELNRYFLDSFNQSLDATATTLAMQVSKYLGNKELTPDTEGDLEQFVVTFAQMSHVDIYILDKSGTVLDGSNTLFPKGQKRIGPEITRALSGNKAPVVRQDPKSHQLITYLAVPIRINSQVVGVVYEIAPMYKIYQTISGINVLFYSGLVIALVLSGLLGIVLARTITNPIVEITRKASAMSKGDFTQQVQIKSEDEIGQLGQTFNVLSNRLKQALEENAREKNQIEAILLHMSDGVLAFAGDGSVLLINPMARQFLGISETDPVEEMLESMVPNSISSEMFHGTSGEYTVEGVEGRILRVYVSPVYEGKNALGRVWVLRDITEEEQEQRRRRDFVANVSHEIRTPLTTVKSYLEALEDGAMEEPETAKRFLNVMHSETDRMVRLVTDLLQLSRLDAGKEGMRLRAVSCRELFDDVMDRFGVQCRRNGIALSTNLEVNLPLLYADPDLLNQVWDNLISNAIKYTPSGGTIRIAAARHGSNRIAIAVSDSGIGIPKKDLPRIFERFYRVDKARSRQSGGTGLGLSIVRQIIEAHGGTIWVESEIDKGTTVTFSLRTVEGGSL